MKAFWCRGCGEVYKTESTTVDGKPIEQWWVDRGRRCTPCLGLANPSTLHHQALIDRLGSSRKATIQERFEAFHADNPWVYTALVELIEFLRAKGVRKLGIGMLWEQLRWRVFLVTHDANSGFKLNDHYRSRYVRLLVESNPHYADLFELRQLRSA